MMFLVLRPKDYTRSPRIEGNSLRCLARQAQRERHSIVRGTLCRRRCDVVEERPHLPVTRGDHLRVLSPVSRNRSGRSISGHVAELAQRFS